MPGRQWAEPGPQQSSSSKPRLAGREGQRQLLCPCLRGSHQMVASPAGGHTETRHSGVSTATWSLCSWRVSQGYGVHSCCFTHLGRGVSPIGQCLAKVTPGAKDRARVGPDLSQSPGWRVLLPTVRSQEPRSQAEPIPPQSTQKLPRSNLVCSAAPKLASWFHTPPLTCAQGRVGQRVGGSPEILRLLWFLPGDETWPKADQETHTHTHMHTHLTSHTPHITHVHMHPHTSHYTLAHMHAHLTLHTYLTSYTRTPHITHTHTSHHTHLT